MLNINLIASIFHFLCFLTVLILYLVFKSSRPAAIVKLYRNQLSGPITQTVPPVSPNTLSFCSNGGANGPNPGQCTVAGSLQQPLKVSSVNVVIFCMIFFIITSIFHGIYAWDGYIPLLSKHGQGFYSTVINEGWNPYRWIEYSITASLMSVILGAVQGTGDIVSIVFMGGVTAAMQFSGFCVEAVMKKSIVNDLGYIQKYVVLGSTLAGWILFVFLWFNNLYCFLTIANDTKNKFKGVIDPKTNEQIKINSFVYFLIIFKILGYASFGFIQLYHIAKNWNVKNVNELYNFHTIENLYLFLSFISKFGLAGGVSYGLLLQTKDCTY
jgi:hypothetical protein